MAKSTNLNLELTDSNNILFRDYRKALNGVGENDDKSNAQIIDEFAGKFVGGTPAQYLKKSSNAKFDMEWETADDTPAENSDKLLSSKGAFDAINTAKSEVDTGSSVTVTDSGAVVRELVPDKFYSFTGGITSLNITLGASKAGRENEYKGQFVAGSVVPTVTFPNTVSWVGGAPVIEANKTYQFSILNGIGVIVGV